VKTLSVSVSCNLPPAEPPPLSLLGECRPHQKHPPPQTKILKLQIGNLAKLETFARFLTQ